MALYRLLKISNYDINNYVITANNIVALSVI